MSRVLVRYCIAWLMAVLLPLHAVAAGRLAACAESMPPVHAKTMTHCERMAATQQPSADTTTQHHSHDTTAHDTTGCWLGSICLASIAAFAIPMQPVTSGMPQGSPTYLTRVTHYRSVVLDDPPRPPAVL